MYTIPSRLHLPTLTLGNFSGLLFHYPSSLLSLGSPSLSLSTVKNSSFSLLFCFFLGQMFRFCLSSSSLPCLFLYISWALSLMWLLLLAYCVWIGVCVIRTPLGGDPCDCIVHVIFGVPLNYSDECVHYFFAWELNFFKQKKYVFLPQNIDLSLSGVKCDETKFYKFV